MFRPSLVLRGAVLACCAPALIATMTLMKATTQSTRAGAANQTVEIWIGGDVNLGDGGRNQLDSLAGMVKGAVGIINLEGPVTQKGELTRDGLRLWNAPQILAELKRLNVRVAGIANNHSGDAGVQSASRTARHLRQAGLKAAGLEAGAAYLEIENMRIAVTAHDLINGVPGTLAQELRDARSKADLLIATFHVTGPPSYLPKPELKKAVEIALAQGASVVAAHGTHAVGPVERRGNAVVAWGLGNVAFACDCTRESEALILRIRLRQGNVMQAEVLPIQAGLNGTGAKFSKDAAGIFDLLEAIGSSRLNRRKMSASF